MLWRSRSRSRNGSGKLAEIRPHLDERAWRLLLGAEAPAIGRGGIKLVAGVAGVAADTVGRGAGELGAGIVADGRIRRAGAGRPAPLEEWIERSKQVQQLVDPVWLGCSSSGVSYR